MHPDNAWFRISLLLSAAGITISSNWLSQMYVTLQPEISRARGCAALNATAGAECCTDCLGIGDFNYNVFHGVAFAVGLSSLPFGFLLDKFGHFVSVVVLACAVAGSAMIAFGSSLSPSRFTLPLMLVGAGVWGLGLMPAYVARERVIGTWFRAKNLRLAFGVAGAVNRIPSLLTFTLTEKLREAAGLQLTMWTAVMVCAFSLICAICASLLDAHGSRQLGRTDEIKREASEVGVFDLRHANAEYWLLLGGFVLLSTSVFTYMDNSVEFVNEKFGFTKSQAALIAGMLHYVGIVASPAAGIVIDKFGHSCLFFCGGSVSLMLGISLLAFTNAHPAVGTALIGVAYCVVSPAVYASVPLVVPSACLGVGTSLFICCDSVQGVLTHAAVGRILGSELGLPLSLKLPRWTLAMSLLLATASGSFAFAVALEILSRLRKGVLAKRPGDEYQKISGDSSESSK